MGEKKTKTLKTVLDQPAGSATNGQSDKMQVDGVTENEHSTEADEALRSKRKRKRTRKRKTEGSSSV